MKLIITDTNVLFDIINIGALPEFFSLDLEILTTVFVLEEVTSPQQRELIETFIRAKKLDIVEFSENEIDEIANFDLLKNLKRFTDKSVIWKSLQLKCSLLTGDKKMREVAEKLGLEVHGTIWVIDELFNGKRISSPKALALLERLMQTNNWLPKGEIEKRINKIKGK